MCLYEYDQEKHIALERRENFEKGVEQGIEQGIKLTKEALYLKSAGREISEIAHELQVSEDQVQKMLED